MTVTPSIDPARLLEEQLAQASPDLLRELLDHVHQHADVGRGRRGLRRRLRHEHPGADQPSQRLPAPRLRHPGRHPGRGDPEASARGPTSRSGCSSAASAPSGR